MTFATRTSGMRALARRILGAAFALTLCLFIAPAQAADPIKIGFSMALTGGVAPNGKQMLIALEIWRADVNAKGGLLGRQVELVYYDDQSNPANVPGIYQKLLKVDNVDLLIGPYATNMVAPAMPVIMGQKKTTIGLLALGINQHFKYPQYFSMVPAGPDGIKSFSEGFFKIASEQKPKPKTVAIVSADAEFAKTAAGGAKANAEKYGFKVVYDKSYPPPTQSFGPIIRAVKAADPDIVFVASYPPDTVGIVRAIHEIDYKPKMLGGTMIGLLVTPLRAQLGPLMNGITIMESFTPAPTFNFPGLQAVLAEYGKRAQGQKIDPFGYGFVPFAYAAGQILAEAVTQTKGVDNAKIANYIRSHEFDTVAGKIKFGKDGEWAQSRMVFSQFQNVEPNNLMQFKDTKHLPVVWPEKYATGKFIYPYADAVK